MIRGVEKMTVKMKQEEIDRIAKKGLTLSKKLGLSVKKKRTRKTK